MRTIGDRLDTFFDSIKDEEAQTYSNYWETVKPKNETEIFQRYLFAFMSVHTTWKMNCLGYNGVKDFKEWGGNREVLRGKIYKARVGMHNNRANYIGLFHDNFWDSPRNYVARQKGERWTNWRDRLAKGILGLGKAKSSFAIEMLFPNDAEVACMDVHLFRLYGLEQKQAHKYYHIIEHDWVERSRKRGIAPYMARCIYWDRKQNRKNSRYWSKVLEA